jgi:hypothetical protein
MSASIIRFVSVGTRGTTAVLTVSLQHQQPVIVSWCDLYMTANAQLCIPGHCEDVDDSKHHEAHRQELRELMHVNAQCT